MYVGNKRGSPGIRMVRVSNSTLASSPDPISTLPIVKINSTSQNPPKGSKFSYCRAESRSSCSVRSFVPTCSPHSSLPQPTFVPRQPPPVNFQTRPSFFRISFQSLTSFLLCQVLHSIVTRVSACGLDSPLSHPRSDLRHLRAILEPVEAPCDFKFDLGWTYFRHGSQSNKP
jgi:hypothetical protein